MAPHSLTSRIRLHEKGSVLMMVMAIAILIGSSAFYFSRSLLDRKRDSEVAGLTLARNTVVQRFEAVFGLGLNPNYPGAFTDAIVAHHSRVKVGDQNIHLAECVFGTTPGKCETGKWIPIQLFTAAAAKAAVTQAIATPFPVPNPRLADLDPGGPLPGLIVAAGEASGNNRTRAFYNRKGENCKIAEPNELCPIEANSEFCASAVSAKPNQHECPAPAGTVEQAARILFRVTISIAPEMISKFVPIKPAKVEGDFTPQEIISAVP